MIRLIAFCVVLGTALSGCSGGSSTVGAVGGNAGGGAESSSPSTSDAKYVITDWNTNAKWESWEVSNGFLMTQYHQAQMLSFKLPFANCIGFEDQTIDVPPATEQFLICQTTKAIVIDECDYNNNPTKFTLKMNEMFAWQGLNARYCGAWMYHIHKV